MLRGCAHSSRALGEGWASIRRRRRPRRHHHRANKWNDCAPPHTSHSTLHGMYLGNKGTHLEYKGTCLGSRASYDRVPFLLPAPRVHPACGVCARALALTRADVLGAHTPAPSVHLVSVGHPRARPCDRAHRCHIRFGTGLTPATLHESAHIGLPQPCSTVRACARAHIRA